MAHLILWEFRPLAGREAEFETTYGPGGDWVRFFARSREYLGTELLRDQDDPCRYFTLDRWTTREAYENFRRRHLSEYEELDRRSGQVTAHERPWGSFNTLDP